MRRVNRLVRRADRNSGECLRAVGDPQKRSCQQVANCGARANNRVNNLDVDRVGVVLVFR